MINFKGKKILITGATGGIGHALVKKFVSLEPSNNEISKSLEQLRALDAKMTIGVSYVKNIPVIRITFFILNLKLRDLFF